MVSTEKAWANAAMAALLGACGRSDLGRDFLRSLPAADRETALAMAAEHRERIAALEDTDTDGDE